ncbi:MAG: macrocin O-methyltransferase [Deltaproteobacteria bacterium HGW-Deltaproteobacteria-19]|jgi:hypothetical protein|nr:MAG: macrocin O-methyltransferase [Deltaproteobacteria bacterium HGW-Deltaproteobacteria-19]
MLRVMMKRLMNPFAKGKIDGDRASANMPPDMEEEFRNMYESFREYTMTSIERMYALYQAVHYIVEGKIDGDIVECGVWKGGSVMLCAAVMLAKKDLQRKFYLYDTYSGMTEPTDNDVDYLGKSAKDVWWQGDAWEWTRVSLDEVRKNIFSIGYPDQNIFFVKGKVEETIPATVPEKISVLHLDTDWYASTYHELVHLYPKIVPGGVIIIDDYGHFKGAREAVDQYIRENDIKIFLNRIDYTGRIGIVVPS